MTAWPLPPLQSRLAASKHLPFVGRHHELVALESVWADVEHARRQLVLIGGEPGAGKTRLVAEVARILHDDGVVVLLGTSSPDAGVPYQPFAEMLDHLFGTAPAGSLSALVGSGGEELRHLSPQVAQHLASAAASSPGPVEVRRELFEAVAQFFRRVAVERPLALVLDDLHWAQLPSLALLEHVVQACADARVLVIATFRNTAPDRSHEVAARVAELHRLEGVHRLDLGGLDTDAIAELLVRRTGLPASAARTPAAILRDRTGGNPFFLRELWADLERQGGIAALRADRRVPESIADTLAARVGRLGEDVRRLIEVAAVVGDQFDLPTLAAASGSSPAETMAFVDAATANGLIEPGEVGGRWLCFVHSLTRQAVADRLAPSQRTALHAKVGEALERQPSEPSLVPRIAHHYLAAHILGYHDKALRFGREAGVLAERSLAFEDAAAWFERTAGLPECDSAVREELLFAAAADLVRACQFPRARALYERLATTAAPLARLESAIGFEDATWRWGPGGFRAAELLSSAIDESGLDEHHPTRIRALGSLGRALTLAGETERARRVGTHAIELARGPGDPECLAHVLSASLWHGTTPDMAAVQADRVAEVYRMGRERRDWDMLGAAANIGAMLCYMTGRADDLQGSLVDSRRAAETTGQPYHRYIYGCLAHSDAFLRGDLAGAERWADESRETNDAFGEEISEGPHAVQMFMIHRESGALERFRPYLDGRESFKGRWVPGLLALYTELGLEHGIRRSLGYLMQRDLARLTYGAEWPMELVFMIEGALALRDVDAVATLRPFLAAYAGLNLVSGTLVATFGSAAHFEGRIAALLGEDATAERCFGAALEMDRRTRSVVHASGTFAQHALFAASCGRNERSRHLAREARALAEPIGQGRVLRALAALGKPATPDGLTERELDVLRLLAGGLSNQEIGVRLAISTNTAANHVRNILVKTGAANRTQAAMYAARHVLV